MTIKPWRCAGNQNRSPRMIAGKFLSWPPRRTKLPYLLDYRRPRISAALESRNITKRRTYGLGRERWPTTEVTSTDAHFRGVTRTQRFDHWKAQWVSPTQAMLVSSSVVSFIPPPVPLSPSNPGGTWTYPEGDGRDGLLVYILLLSPIAVVAAVPATVTLYVGSLGERRFPESPWGSELHLIERRRYQICRESRARFCYTDLRAFMFDGFLLL